jgi:hypothetical protein
LCLEPYALSREIEERSLARLRWEGNAADDALMVDQGPPQYACQYGLSL